MVGYFSQCHEFLPVTELPTRNVSKITTGYLLAEIQFPLFRSLLIASLRRCRCSVSTDKGKGWAWKRPAFTLQATLPPTRPESPAASPSSWPHSRLPSASGSSAPPTAPPASDPRIGTILWAG